MATISDPPKPDANRSPDELKVVLAGFEISLLTPSVSGELGTWLKEVQKSWEKVSEQIHLHADYIHPRQFDEISKQDPELFSKIEQMQAEDESINAARDRLSQLIGRTGQRVPKMEPDEEKAQKHIKAIIDRGIAFLIQVRKQEVAIQTWYVEAFSRDHGAVD